MSEAVALAMDSLRKNRLRSLLTVLGVVIGVTTVIGMSSVIEGLNSSISSQIADLGSNLIFVYKFNPTVPGRRPPSLLNRPELTLEDAEAVGELPHVDAVAPMLRWFQPSPSATAFTVRYQDRIAKNTIIEGVSPHHADVFNLRLSAGRFINEADHRHRSSVMVIGHDTAETLFPVHVNPVGKEVRLEGAVFQIVGVLEKRRDALTPGANPNDNVVEIPLASFWRLHPEFKDFWFSVKPTSAEDMPEAIDEIENLLRRRRTVPVHEESDFAIFTQDSFTDLWNQISGGVFAVMLAISSVALLVGGVGVMNIMLVSVTERTREIGIRKAIGATRRHILTQFLIESVALTAVGGMLGVAVGAGVTFLIRTFVPFLPAAMSPFWVALGFLTAVGTGLVFGLYPAYRAAMLDPIEALRHE
jgi:putative ABC transport system permease protein